MMDRGWRRCGDYYYKPNNQLSCCMSYTIRLDVNKFKQERKSHRKAAKRMMKFV